MSKVRSRSVQFSVANSPAQKKSPPVSADALEKIRQGRDLELVLASTSVAVPSPVPSPHRPSPLAEKKIGDAGAKAIAEALRADTIVQRLNLSGACGSLATVRFFLTC